MALCQISYSPSALWDPKWDPTEAKCFRLFPRRISSVKAILSYCGASFPQWRDGQWKKGVGWQDLRRQHYTSPVRTRWLATCDVPDLRLFPERYNGVRDVNFRAGLELPLLHFALWVMALLRRTGVVKDWSRYAVPLKKLSDSFIRFGSDAGAMHVEVGGLGRDGLEKRRRWILIATNDMVHMYRPWPVLHWSANWRVIKSNNGALIHWRSLWRPSSYDSNNLSLPPGPGRNFDLLPHELRYFHSIKGKTTLSGSCSVTGPQTLPGILLGWVFSLPKTAEETTLLFELEADSQQETWRRHLPNRMMASGMRVAAGMLIERLGPVDLHFSLKAENGKLIMLLNGISLAGLPCPKFLIPSVIAEEMASAGKLHFNVAVRLPL